MTQDPIGLAGGMNFYNYPLDPVQFVDPLGLAIEYANHKVAFGNYHSKIVITPINQAAYANDMRFGNIDANGNRFATLGAGPDGFWNLKSGVNREKDVNEAMMNRQPLGVAGQCINEDAYIQKLFALSENYNNNQVGYTLLPSNSDQYNSNSFISGLGAAAGLDMPTATGTKTPGYEFPVPIENFTQGLK